MINKVILIGNLGRDPEVRHLDSGAVVAKFSIATNESYKDKSGEWQQVTEWHDVVVWRNLAERAERTLKKGKLVYIEGKLTHRKWQDKEGKDRYNTEVVANTLRLLERKEVVGGYSESTPVNTEVGEKANSPITESTETPDPVDDDLPF